MFKYQNALKILSKWNYSIFRSLSTSTIGGLIKATPLYIFCVWEQNNLKNLTLFRTLFFLLQTIICDIINQDANNIESRIALLIWLCNYLSSLLIFVVIPLFLYSHWRLRIHFLPFCPVTLPQWIVRQIFLGFNILWTHKLFPFLGLSLMLNECCYAACVILNVEA